jgi:putative NIF3 family GTP cyclohydrolase 1 type 2
LAQVVAALRRSHPYEEPAFDVYPLLGEPVRGIGRVGTLPAGTTLGGLLARLVRSTGSKVATRVGAAGTRVRRAAVCAGAAGRLPFEKPRAAACDLIVTGEIRHHDALAILRSGKTAIALGHWESERPVLEPLGRRLANQLPGLRVKASRADAGPLER